ncbi:MFS transporter [Sinimarinibacterium sp. CAU 1509]|uniref:MFS transporter n=1 Tax=Sinimarinibacterium sp. CAU 1509 TaxID=2562283 RepID=UPI0010AD9839|nr:MFS transporter [Sinimarinibacterium sp. CAU 1509]TJY55406.1 MFS transporter [Sinimarinibacterium sp. CAU 1509]
MRTTTLSRGMLLAFSLPAIMQGFTHTAAGQLLSGVYAKFLGLPLGALGTAVLACKIFDAVTDPLIGVISDAHKRRGGSRKSWVVAGSLLAAFALWFLLRPPEGVGIAYFTVWYLLVYLGWTVAEIPYRAWSVEITQDYQDRTRVAVWLFVTALVGAIVVFVVPILGPVIGFAESQEVTPVTLSVLALITAVATPVLCLVAIRRVPEGTAATETHDEAPAQLLHSVVGNRPLLWLTGLFLMYSFASGMMQGVLFLYVDVYLGLSKHLAVVLLITGPMAVLATPIWGWLCGRYEKHRAWAFAATGQAIAVALMGLVTPGESALGLVIALTLLNFFFGAAAGVAMPALLGDVVDYGSLQFRRECAGTYYAFYTLMQKSISGAGIAAGMFLIARFGFDATSAAQTPNAVAGIKLAYAYVPAALVLLTAPALLRFPIDRKRHAQIVSALRTRRASVAPATVAA